jgi:hypothetical protein
MNFLLAFCKGVLRFSVTGMPSLYWGYLKEGTCLCRVGGWLMASCLPLAPKKPQAPELNIAEAIAAALI